MRLLRLTLQFYLTLAIPLLYLAILYIISITAQTFPIQFSPIIQIIFLTSALTGALIWAISYYQLRHAFGVLPRTLPKVTTGLYRLFPHPMYAGIFLLFNGLALATSSWPGFLANLLVLTPINIIRARLETRQLTNL